MRFNDDRVSDEDQLVVFKLGDEEFGVDISQVREIIKLVEITKMPNSPVFVEGVINLRGSIATVIDLRKRLGIESNGNSEDTRIIIVELGNDIVGMIVDSVTEVLRMSVRDIDESALLTSQVEAEYVRGVGKLEDRILILLDLNKALTKGEVAQIEKISERALV
jgi:purine-binding chemotaxis protein CheW